MIMGIMKFLFGDKEKETKVVYIIAVSDEEKENTAYYCGLKKKRAC